MQKLIDAYRNNPTLANAGKVARHSDKHPMAACMLLPSDALVLQAAIDHANRES